MPQARDTGAARAETRQCLPSRPPSPRRGDLIEQIMKWANALREIGSDWDGSTPGHVRFVALRTLHQMEHYLPVEGMSACSPTGERARRSWVILNGEPSPRLLGPDILIGSGPTNAVAQGSAGSTLARLVPVRP